MEAPIIARLSGAIALLLSAGVGAAVYWAAVPPDPPAESEDPAELERTWDAALVRIPTDSGVWDGAPEAAPVAPGSALPLVIYLHGCAGLGRDDDPKLERLALRGYAAIAPDSFARRARPDSCELATRRGGLERTVLFLRQAEARYALERALRLPWVDPGAVFLLGFSEGGTAAATVDTGRVLAGRIIEAWTCHSPWREYNGLNSPPGEPVLALLASRDPWYRVWYQYGDCGDFFRADGSRSVVFDERQLADSHSVLWHDDARAELEAFLERHRLTR